MKKTKRPPTDPVSIFRHGEDFFEAYKRLDDQSAAFYPNAVMVVNIFASELYFKALICLETGSCQSGHYLHNLFSYLSKHTQELLDQKWQAISKDREAIFASMEYQNGQKISRDLIGALKAGNKSFELIRYLYEGGEPFQFNLSDLPLALRRTILHLQPTWGHPDNGCLGLTLAPDITSRPERVRNGSFGFATLGGSWLENDRYCLIPVPRNPDNTVLVHAYKTPERRLSVTLSGALGMSFIFDVALPSPTPAHLLIGMSWKDTIVDLYLNGQFAQGYDLTSGIAVSYNTKENR